MTVEEERERVQNKRKIQHCTHSIWKHSVKIHDWDQPSFCPVIITDGERVSGWMELFPVWQVQC